MPNNDFLPQRGNYRGLVAYQKAECIYDLTYFFATKFLAVGDRTVDQMVQAARSGKQNIAEGSAASATSRETEIKLTNVAKASLQDGRLRGLPACAWVAAMGTGRPPFPAGEESLRRA